MLMVVVVILGSGVSGICSLMQDEATIPLSRFGPQDAVTEVQHMFVHDWPPCRPLLCILYEWCVVTYDCSMYIIRALMQVVTHHEDLLSQVTGIEALEGKSTWG